MKTNNNLVLVLRGLLKTMFDEFIWHAPNGIRVVNDTVYLDYVDSYLYHEERHVGLCLYKPEGFVTYGLNISYYDHSELLSFDDYEVNDEKDIYETIFNSLDEMLSNEMNRNECKVFAFNTIEQDRMYSKLIEKGGEDLTTEFEEIYGLIISLKETLNVQCTDINKNTVAMQLYSNFINVVRYSSEGRIIEAESLEFSGRDLDLFDLLLQINPFNK